MPRPLLEDSKYLTLPQVAQRLGLGQSQVLRRIERGLLPKPTIVKSNGLRLFDEEWLEKVR